MTFADVPMPRIVLDTNVCLDLLLFHDPACASLLAALRGGRVQAVTRDDCRDEWRRVLHYPQLPITDAARPSISAAFDELVRHLPAGSRASTDPVRLPLCADPDDQKFLELALESGARWLLSKDLELLKLGARTRRAGLFEILRPQDWCVATV